MLRSRSVHLIIGEWDHHDDAEEEVRSRKRICINRSFEFFLSDEGTVKKHLWLPRRSLLVLRREARFLWRHGIASRMNDKHLGEIIERSRRLSLTFRHVSVNVSSLYVFSCV